MVRKLKQYCKPVMEICNVIKRVDVLTASYVGESGNVWNTDPWEE